MSGNQPQVVDSHPRSDATHPETQKRMIRDFDGGANGLWNLYRNEAKSYDEAHIQTLKDDMDGVLIFVRFDSYPCIR